ncbi:MAG: hypothetical protein ACI4XE_10455 [Acutalibacteraceae bacterium]
MRPIRDLFFEDYWCIGYRTFSDDDSVVNSGKEYTFDILKATKRFWYADPFLFEKNGDIFLFVEMYDNTKEKGVIGCSKYINGKFTTPSVVLEESFHLSYPFVFENDGEIFMMPETRRDHCVQIYKAVDFPNKWQKYRRIVEADDIVDSCVYNGIVFTSKITNPEQMETQLELYDLETGRAFCNNPVTRKSQTERGAGSLFERKDKLIRPVQNCTGANYGKGIYFYEVTRLDEFGVTQDIISKVTPDNLNVIGLSPKGIHTYSCLNHVEVVDMKARRFNFKRLLWIFLRKIRHMK